MLPEQLCSPMVLLCAPTGFHLEEKKEKKFSGVNICIGCIHAAFLQQKAKKK